MAYLGLLDDAAPLFGSRPSVARAGVLLALPPLMHSGVFECAQTIYGSLGPAFYGLRTSLLTLLLMALWRTSLLDLAGHTSTHNTHPVQSSGAICNVNFIPFHSGTRASVDLKVAGALASCFGS